MERSGHRVVAYDARGHGRSSPAPTYGYRELGGDLEAVMDALGIERAVLAGASMGAHTSLWMALQRPERVGGVVVITPSYDPATNDKFTDVRKFGGEPGKRYKVTIRVRGVVEPMMYNTISHS